MTGYPDEKSNNPYQQWQQPAEPPYGAQYPAQAHSPFQDPYQPQGQYHTPSGPPPAYVQQPYYPPDNTGASTRSPYPDQGYNQQQTYQPPPGPPQGYQSPPPSNHYDQKGSGGYPPYQQGPPGPGASYDRSVGGAMGYSSHHQGPPPQDALHPYYNQTPGAGPSPQGGPSSATDRDAGSTGMSLGSFFGDKGPPPMWQRQPPPNLPYNQFPPMCLISNGKELNKGFPELPPPTQLTPHPFSTHDIAEEDWKRFLTDVKKAGSLTGAQRIKSNVIPMVTGMSLLGGFFMTNMIEKKMKHKNRTAAGDVVDHWNHYFFGPRRMEAVLCQASERLSGREGAAPLGDPNQARMANNLRRRQSDSSSDSSDSEDDRRGGGYHHAPPARDYRSDRRARRAERREGRRARKAERRDRKAKGDFDQPYQLFIQAI
ncbi:hypothetical protein BJ138DRAFT_889209 [Hygrophoropsis aurantiaca]|uniref:Uncharacterized protein n=1 Tax=Hygrophoropsis aurantiaca TaxID=72124 RepID=A0ACB8AET9_9AGAM|nr:hypothetical protein BJ138DRAFT_889209 [Hygrophoropsis aurantiaca]